jgi:inosine/xanthosine triphosphatase
MLIVVGSTNASKLESVRLSLPHVFPNLPASSITIEGLSVASGVSAQPMTDVETQAGALSRARSALSAAREKGLDPDYAVGLEGGVGEVGGVYMECGWIAVVDARDEARVGWGTSARFQLCEKIVQRLKAGEELAEVMDDLSGLVDVRSGQGAMGLVTNGAVKRAEAYSTGVIFAFAKFISNRIFWE